MSGGNLTFTLPSFNRKKLGFLFPLLIIILIGFIGYKYLLPYLGSQGVAVPLYKGKVVGTVFKTDGKIPLEGAKVFISGKNEPELSDSSGKFYFYDISLGAKTLTVSKNGHEEQSIKVKVVLDQETEADVILPVEPIVSGDKIIAEKTNDSSATEIWILDKDGKNEVKLLEGDTPEVLKGEKEIVYNKGGYRYQAYLDGSGEHKVGGEIKQTGSYTSSPYYSSLQTSMVSPDKTKVALIDAGDIWLSVGNEKKRITSIADFSLKALGWVPNSSDRMVYVTGKGVYTVKTDGSDTKTIYEGDFQGIAWSYDFYYFAFKKFGDYSESCYGCSEKEKKELEEKNNKIIDENGVWIADTTDGSKRKATDIGKDIFRDFFWIPGSHYFVFKQSSYRDEYKSGNGIYLVNAENVHDKGQRIWDQDKADVRVDFNAISWAQDKKALITNEGYLIRFDQKSQKKITDRQCQFNWLLSGKIIFACISGEKGTWVTDSNADNQKRISDHVLNLAYSASSDKNTLLFEGESYLWIMDTNGENLKQITTETGFKNPRWL